MQIDNKNILFMLNNLPKHPSFVCCDETCILIPVGYSPPPPNTNKKIINLLMLF